MLLEHTRQQSRESAALSEVLAGPLAQRLSHISEDVGRIVKKSKDLVQQLQAELLEVVSELQTVSRTCCLLTTGSRNSCCKPLHLPIRLKKWMLMGDLSL